MKNGSFVISLDFELHWGIFDHKSILDYRTNLENVRLVIRRLLDLCEKYNVNITFSVVGFLFAENKKELIKYKPNLTPSYINKQLNPYSIFPKIGNNQKDDPYHYAKPLIEEIKLRSNHEIGTHTFCHYYCVEKGQTINQFKADIKAAISIASAMEIDIKNIVFPRNQVNKEYLKTCADLGLTSYRGTENNKIYKPVNSNKNILIYRMIRLLDSYINVTGYNTYNKDTLTKDKTLVNIPSSRFLRPYSKRFNFFEPLKIKRIKRAMRYAAINNEIFHLWWHPHNFGRNINENFNNLEQIFKEYKELNLTYNFNSHTMSELVKKTIQ